MGIADIPEGSLVIRNPIVNPKRYICSQTFFHELYQIAMTEPNLSEPKIFGRVIIRQHRTNPEADRLDPPTRTVIPCDRFAKGFAHPIVAIRSNGIPHRDFRRLRLGVKVQVWLEALIRSRDVVGTGEDHSPYLKLAGGFEDIARPNNIGAQDRFPTGRYIWVARQVDDAIQGTELLNDLSDL